MNEQFSVRAATIMPTDEDGRLYMSVSSDVPVITRIWRNGAYIQAYEILDHSEGSVDLSRAAEGLVVLDRHGGDQIGLMTVELADGKMRGMVDFCSGQRAQEIKADAEKGLRRNVSIGYVVDSSSYVEEGERDGVAVVRAKSWMPYEASFEPVPADFSVGVGRSAEVVEIQKKEAKKMDHKQLAALMKRAADNGIDIAKVEELVTDEATVESIRAAVDEMIIAKQKSDVDALRVEVSEAKKEREKMKDQQMVVPELGGDAKREIGKRYSVMNVLRSLAGGKDDIGFEREMSDELARLRGKPANGIIVPHDALAKRDFTVSGTSSASVATDLMAGDFIELLRTKSILAPLGVRFMSGLVGNVAIPKNSAGCTGYWVSEAGAITESQPTLGQITGTPHTCGVMTDISRRLLIQSTPSAEQIVRDEIIERIARTIQIAVFAGTGADGQPSAITNATGINNPSISSAGTPTYAEILAFISSIYADNAAGENMKWAMTAEVWATLCATMRTATYGDIPVLDPASPLMLGYQWLTSEDLPANSLWFGDWSTVIVGIWGSGLDISADVSTLSSSGGLRIVGLQDVDVMVRNGEKLAYNTAVTA